MQSDPDSKHSRDNFVSDGNTLMFFVVLAVGVFCVVIWTVLFPQKRNSIPDAPSPTSEFNAITDAPSPTSEFNAYNDFLTRDASPPTSEFNAYYNFPTVDQRCWDAGLGCSSGSCESTAFAICSQEIRFGGMSKFLNVTGGQCLDATKLGWWGGSRTVTTKLSLEECKTLFGYCELACQNEMEACIRCVNFRTGKVVEAARN